MAVLRNVENWKKGANAGLCKNENFEKKKRFENCGTDVISR